MGFRNSITLLGVTFRASNYKNNICILISLYILALLLYSTLNLDNGVTSTSKRRFYSVNFYNQNYKSALKNSCHFRNCWMHSPILSSQSSTVWLTNDVSKLLKMGIAAFLKRNNFSCLLFLILWRRESFYLVGTPFSQLQGEQLKLRLSWYQWLKSPSSQILNQDTAKVRTFWMMRNPFFHWCDVWKDFVRFWRLEKAETISSLGKCLFGHQAVNIWPFSEVNKIQLFSNDGILATFLLHINVCVPLIHVSQTSYLFRKFRQWRVS